jgi:anti-sigma factor RsiW
MMAGMHPEELDLLAHVDGELAGARRDALREHLEACPACAATARELEAGRAALAAAPPLELSSRRRKRISTALDAHPPTRRVYVSPLRGVTILAPLVVAAVIVAAIVGGGDGGDGTGPEAAEPSVRMEAATGEAPTSEAGEGTDDAGGGGAQAAPEDRSALGAAAGVASVRGPAREVAALLRRRGFEARVGGRDLVIVRDAPRAAVAGALEGRRQGGVVVIVE